MICKKCGKELRDGTLYCPYCGANVGYMESAARNKKVDFDTETNTELKGNNSDRTYKNHTTPKYDIQSTKKKPGKKKKGLIIALVIILFIAALAAASIFTYKYFNTGSGEKSVLQESMELQKQAGHYTHPTQMPTQTPAPSELSALTEQADTRSPSPMPEDKPQKNEDSRLKNSSSDGYDTYENSVHGLVCDFPSYMTMYDDNTSEGLLSVRDSANNASVRICARENIYGDDAQAVYDSFRKNSSGVTEYESVNKNSFTYRTLSKNHSTYCHAILKNDSIYWFEVSYDTNQEDKFEEYIDHIYNSFKVD